VDREQVFDEDYLYFYGPSFTDEANESQVDLIVRLLEIEPGMQLLDLACGHGRIANRLAARGVRVTGLDATPMFLEIAQRDAAALGVHVEYVQGDMRSLAWESRFDRAISWFTSWGYFEDDAENKLVLDQVQRALAPGGRFLLDTPNLLAVARHLRPEWVTERNGDFLIDRARLDATTSRQHVHRVVVRDGRTRRFDYAVRMLTPTELRGWLRDVGFTSIESRGSDGDDLTLDSWRMITIARN
jgi:2-polyprenyl-3-methyl-5-hydroxy-6-metoxy-1,4-benzoquinol methylase